MPPQAAAAPAAATRELEYRSYSLRASTLDAEHRTIMATVASEAPVPMYDHRRGEVVPEILLASGVVLPASRQVVLLENHSRRSNDDTLGSARELLVEGSEIRAKLHFSSLAESQWTKVREGHITDVSAGYMVLEKTFVERGQTLAIEGRTIAGPANVVTRWKLKEVSVTPIGADEQAKMRGAAASGDAGDPGPKERIFSMDEQLRTLTRERMGKPEATDDDIRAFLLAELQKQTGPDGADRQADPPGQTSAAAGDDGQRREPPAGDSLRAAVREAIDEERRQRAAFVAEARALCDLADRPELYARAEACDDVAAVRRLIQDEKARQSHQEQVPGAPRITITGEGRSRQLEAMGTALNLRALENISASEASLAKVLPVDKRSKDADDFQYFGPREMANRCLLLDGYSQRELDRLSPDQRAQVALGFAEQIGVRSSGVALHNTSSFLKLTADAMNKSMMVGYTEAPSTWLGPMRRAPSVPDFKTIHRIRAAAIPNLPIWPDNTEPKKARIGDAEETYAVDARSLAIDFSYRLLVNDDMDVLSRKPREAGDAAARTVNAFAWSLLTANPLLGDGVALFSAASGARKRSNLTTGAGAPSTSTLQTLTNLMRQMRGENTPEGAESDDILNLSPTYLIGPSALETTIMQLIKSTYDPADANQKFNTARGLMPVIEPLLDASSTTAWYLFASPQRIDTIELTFLQGQERPLVRSDRDFQTLSQQYIVLQTFGGKAMNHRGVQKHAGA